MPRKLHKDTLSVRGGLNRSDNSETSEALYLNSGFVYQSAEVLKQRSAVISTAMSIRVTPTPP